MSERLSHWQLGLAYFRLPLAQVVCIGSHDATNNNLISGQIEFMETTSGDLSDLFAADRAWLAAQPGMQPWGRGCQDLLGEMESWVLTASTELCEMPVTRDDPRFPSFVRRLWQCWRYHWCAAAAAAVDNRLRGTVVADDLRAGRGPGNGARMGGNPLRDAVWVEAMLQGDNRAIRLFDEWSGPLVRAWSYQINLALGHDLAWWQDMAAKLIGSPTEIGKFSTFKGQAGLEPWLKKVVKRELIRQSKRRHRESERREEFRNSLDETDRTTPADDAVSVECIKLLSGVFKEVFHASKRNERLAARLLLVDGVKQSDACRVLKIHKGNVSKTVRSFVGRVRDALGLSDSDKHAADERYRPCLDHLFKSNILAALRGLLVRIIGDWDDTEPPK